MEEERTHVGVTPRQTGVRGCTGLDNPDEPLRCVFSTTSVIKLGTGTTTRKQTNRLLWHVNQEETDSFAVRKINSNFVPVGNPDFIDLDTLLSKYTPEIEIHNTRVEPAMRKLEKTIAKADKHRKQGQDLSAEMEYQKALNIDETNVRSIFGLGLVYLNRGDHENSRTVFEQLVQMKAAFSLQHKHLFNEFGIALRKNELFDEAVKYYGRAAELSTDDENLYFNLARAFYEKDDWNSCFEFISRCLKLNGEQKAALAMCKFMASLHEDSSLCDQYGKPPVPTDVGNQARRLVDGADAMDMTVEVGPDDFAGDTLEDIRNRK